MPPPGRPNKSDAPRDATEAFALDIRNVFAANVRAKRKALGLTQKAAALKCGVEWTYFGHLEGGHRNATIETLQLISGGLGCMEADLLDRRTAYAWMQEEAAQKAASARRRKTRPPSTMRRSRSPARSK